MKRKNKPVSNYQVLVDLSEIYCKARDGKVVDGDIDTMLKALAGMMRIRMYEFNKRAAAFAGMLPDNISQRLIEKEDTDA